MKRTFIRLTALLLISLLSAVVVFAQPVTETQTTVSSTEFHTLNLETAKADEIITGFEKAKEAFPEQKAKLEEKISEAYKNNDSTSFFSLKKEYSQLEYPVINETSTESIKKNILNNEDYNLALWLYKNSRFYKPSIALHYSSDGYSYFKEISSIPGTEFQLPELDYPNSSKEFAGWGLTENEVTYQSGETIKMPLDKLDLYAIFKTAPGIVEGYSVEFDTTDTIAINTKEKKNFSYQIKNNGTEDLQNVSVKLSCDDPLLFVLTDSASTNRFKSGETGSARFSVITNAKSGSEITAMISVSDNKENTWEKELKFLVN